MSDGQAGIRPVRVGVFRFRRTVCCGPSREVRALLGLPDAVPSTGTCRTRPASSGKPYGRYRGQAAVLALHYFEDLPVADIASVLGLAEVTVKAHLHKGRDALRKVIRPPGEATP